MISFRPLQKLAARAVNGAAAFAVLACAACESEPEGVHPVDGFDPRLRGIYSLSSHTLNSAACEPGGDTVAGTEPLFAIDAIDVRGDFLLGAVSCADAVTCRAHVAAAQAPGPDDEIPVLDVDFFFVFVSSFSDGSASALSEAGIALEGGGCSGKIFADELRHAGGLVRIESRITDVPSFDPDANGRCRVPSAAHAEPCNAFELVTGSISEAL